jgi:pentatricopeptide repeat protein
MKRALLLTFPVFLLSCGLFSPMNEQATQAKREFNQARLLVAQKRHAEALTHVESAIRLDPENAVYHEAAGYALFQLKRLDESSRFYEKAAALDPRNARLRDSLGTVYAAAGRMAEAIDQFKKAIDADDDYYEAYVHLAVALSQESRIAEAEKAFEVAWKMQRRSDVGQNMVRHYISLQRPDEAIRILQDMIDAGIEEFNATVTIALIYEDDKKDPQQAIKWFEKALSLDPTNYQVHLNLASTYRNMGNTAKAKEHYERFFQLVPAKGDAKLEELKQKVRSEMKKL